MNAKKYVRRDEHIPAHTKLERKRGELVCVYVRAIKRCRERGNEAE